MSIKKFQITADTTIYNAFKENLKDRGTEANTGLSDSLETFFIYGQTPDPNAAASDKVEEARILLKPDFQGILDTYTNFPSDTKFILRLFNAEHPFTLPKNFTLNLFSIVDSWLEGSGLDMESYRDVGTPNWLKKDATTTWATSGAIDTSTAPVITSQTFSEGTEDMSLDITSFMQANWANLSDHSFVVSFPSSITDGVTQTLNFYTKKFFSRSSEFFFKRPVVEARKASFTGDDRGRLYKSSPLTTNNEQNLYLYNTVSGVRENITGDVKLELFSDSTLETSIVAAVDATRPDTGVYKAVITVPDTVTVETIYEKWTAGATTIKTGSIKLLTREPATNNSEINYVTDITNIKPSYAPTEQARFRIYTRQKDWNPTIYTVASEELENLIVDKMYYKIIRLIDGETVMDYGIGTLNNNKEHTLISYDAQGSYFDFDISSLESGYMYGIKLMFSVAGELKEQPNTFKFRVD